MITGSRHALDSQSLFCRLSGIFCWTGFEKSALLYQGEIGLREATPAKIGHSHARGRKEV
jgi:hypothetical protein